MMYKLISQILFCTAMLTMAASSYAQYKCPSEKGGTTYQQTPCAGAGEKVRIFVEPAPKLHIVGGKAEPRPDLAGPPQAAPLLLLYREWIDAEKLAMSTPRIGLAGPVAALQKLARSAQQAQVEPCMTEAKSALQSLIDLSASSLLEFMRRNELQTAVYTIVDRSKGISRFEGEIERARCE